jgi:serine palmitoyltransferase
LESILIEEIKSKKWKKIIIIAEGIYSMEGDVCKLPELIELKKKYKVYLYIDEAHSVGALGKSGKGICDYFNVNPDDVDILMGTFTKSFGSVGGYVASSKKYIEKLRSSSYSQYYCSPLSPVCAQQIISAINVITGEDGTTIGKEKLTSLIENSKYFREEVKKKGFEVLGDENTPVICLMIYHFSNLSYFSRECLKKGVAIVIVGYPATDIIGSRIRICMSSCHKKEDLKYALDVIDDIGDWSGTKFLKNSIPYIF